jgi:hypothetical protein
MRHLIGVFLAILMAGVLAAGAWGYLRLTALAAHMPGQRSGSIIADHSAQVALIAVAGAGLLAGILVAAPRVSPLAPGLPGLVLLGVTLLYVLSTRRMTALLSLPPDGFGTGPATMLSGGVLGAVGLVMTVPVFIPSRWRARAGAADPAVAGTGEAATVPQGNVEVLTPGRLPGQPGLVAPAPAAGPLLSREHPGPQPAGSGQPAAAGWDAGTQAGQRARPGGPAPRQSTAVRLTSPWRLPEA